MNSLIEKTKNQKGTSLLELLVAVTLFAVIILSSADIFKMVIDGQRNSTSAQNVQENMRYAMEKISREVRMAQRGNNDCEAIVSPQPTATNKVFNLVEGVNDILYFKNKDGICLAYYVENNRLKINMDGMVADFITPAKIEVSNLQFYVIDDLIGAFRTVQPQVTMVMDIKAVGLAMHEQRMKTQTTISSRYYE